MTFQQLLSAGYERANQLQTYWAFYATLVLGVLAFFGSARRSRSIATLVTIGFIAVAAANLLALIDVSRQRLVLQHYLVATAGSDAMLVSLAGTLTPWSLLVVMAFHLLFDLFTIGSIWALTLKTNVRRELPPL
ncbi:MAG: hypothetical protein QM736_13070 [Vicinamibacterales bacterium]